MDHKQNFSALLAQVILPKVEMIAAVIAFIGFLFNRLKQPGASEMVMIGLSTLAGVFFITAFIIPVTIEKGNQEETPKTFIDVLILSVWKVMHISLAVAIIGLLFYLLHLEGFSQMMLIGTMSLVISLLLAGFLILQKDEYLVIFKTVISKALMMAIIGSYILFINWSLITE